MIPCHQCPDCLRPCSCESGDIRRDFCCHQCDENPTDPQERLGDPLDDDDLYQDDFYDDDDEDIDDDQDYDDNEVDEWQ